ncbi:MAG: hypothetical protein LC799_31510, partial [Actinobacteria bacterium]|nr:hypothetical protein [Actinomycetota bacterium]
PVPSPVRHERRSKRVAVTAVTAIALLAALAVGVSRRDTSPRGPSPSAVPEVVTTVPAKAQPLPTDTIPLAAGSYVTSRFQPSLTLTVGDAWKVAIPETSDYIHLVRTGDSSGGLSFVHLTRVLRPGQAYKTKDDLAKAGAVQGAPDDVAAWLAANPNLAVTPPSPITAGKVAGVRVDVNVRTGYQTELCAGACVPLWLFEDARLGRGFLSTGLLYRIYALDVGGQKVLAVLVADADQYGKLAPEVDRLVAALRFAP